MHMDAARYVYTERVYGYIKHYFAQETTLFYRIKFEIQSEIEYEIGSQLEIESMLKSSKFYDKI
jgi:hypothetical protein